MAFDELKAAVYDANMALARSGLVLLTFGNVSGVDRAAGVVAIKPSGVDYDKLTAADIVVVSLDSGEPVEGALRPSSDTPTHLALYRAFDSIGAVVHTHSSYATAWAQAAREIPCFGTTHADFCAGAVPLTRQLTKAEIDGNYEANTGKVIAERFGKRGMDPAATPAVLVAGHGPFVWGETPAKAVENAVILEEVAKMAFQTLLVNPESPPLPQALLDKHFQRKHGPGAYYGQQ